MLTKSTTYLSLVWPTLKYTSSEWGLHQCNQIYAIDHIQLAKSTTGQFVIITDTVVLH